MTDRELLSKYSRENDQQAFAELVQRHVHWVNSMALRLVNGNSAQAADVTQAVFILLARKAATLRQDMLLSGWLFIVTKYAAAKSIREESRRRIHERRAAAMRQEQSSTSTDSVQWESMAAMLDELVHRLRAGDRDAMLLRFYEKKSFSEVGESLNISEEAARKRVSRAIEQLRNGFARRGIAVGAAALATTLSANLTQPASAAVIAGASAAPSVAMTATPLAKGISAMIAWASVKPMAVVVGSILLLAGTTAAVLQLSPAQNQVVAPATMPATAPAALHYGRVVDENDKPVAGALIWHIDRTDYLTMARLAGTTTSDADGRFQLPVVGENEMVVVGAKGYGMGGAELPKRNSADDPVEVRMKPATSLRVKFVDPAGNPAVGLHVRLSGIGNKSPAMRWAAEFPKDTGDSLAQIADAQGVCVFPDLPQDGIAWLDPLDDRYARMGWGEMFDLRSSATTDAGTFKLKFGGSITGRLLFDDTKLPASGVKVLARSMDVKGGVISATTDADGRYELKQLVPSNYNLLPYLSNELSELYASDGRKDVVVRAGPAGDPQDFVLVTGGIIRGRIVEKETGKPIANMGVFIEGAGQPFVGYSQTPRSHEDGTYLVHVVPGTTRVQLELPMPPGMLEPKPIQRNIKVAKDEIAEFNFEIPQHPGPRISGRTVDPQGNILSGVEILAQTSDDYPAGQLVGTSKADGSFELPGLDRTTVLRARKGLWTTLTPISADGAANLTITLRSDAHSSVRAHIVGPDGKPIAGAKVDLTSTMGTGAKGSRLDRGHIYFDTKTTAADGTCVFKEVSPDIAYGFTVAAKGFGKADVQFPIEAGKIVDAPPVTLIKADSFVSGIVLDENGLPVPDISININSEKSDTERVRTDIAGQFRIGDILPGDRVSVIASDDANPHRGARLDSVIAGSDGLVMTLQTRP